MPIYSVGIQKVQVQVISVHLAGLHDGTIHMKFAILNAHYNFPWPSPSVNELWQ